MQVVGLVIGRVNTDNEDDRQFSGVADVKLGWTADFGAMDYDCKTGFNVDYSAFDGDRQRVGGRNKLA